MTDFQTKYKLETILKAIESLNMKFPVVDIANLTGYDKGNVSSYLNGKKSVSGAFINRFQEVFKIDLKDFEEKLEIESDKILTVKDLRVDLNNQILINAVKKLQLRFPIAEIQRATDYGKGDISNFLTNKKPVSDNFLKTFSEAFKIDLNEFSFDNEPSQNKSEEYSIQDYIKTLHQLLEVKDELAAKEKRILFLESEIARLTKIE
jgi:transcriptional regulator with XRE-family HTH domain